MAAEPFVASQSAEGILDPVAFLAAHAQFTTRLFAVATGQRIDSASRWLNRLARRDGLVRVTRGVWAQLGHPAFTPNATTGLLLGNEHGYVSFISALHMCGVLSQIPGAIHVATTGRGRVLDSPVGRFEFVQIQPAMMLDGIEVSTTEPPYAIATAEKALLDTLYIATRRGNRYGRLPELDLDNIDWCRLGQLIGRLVPAGPISRAIETRLRCLRAGTDSLSGSRPSLHLR